MDTKQTDIVLIAGLWLDESVWTEVAANLRQLGHRPHAVRLPGQGDGDSTATLDDQIAAVLAAVDGAESAVVVGHSAACTLAWIAADRRPDGVARAVLIGGFPTTAGDRYADFFEPVDAVMPFPGWEAFEGPDSADLDEAERTRFSAAAIPVPETVSRAIVHYTDERRADTAVTLICPEFGPDDAKAWISNGDVPELASANSVEYVDIDSGHWPMITKPAELARILANITERA